MYEHTNLTSAHMEHQQAIALANQRAQLLPVRVHSFGIMSRISQSKRIELPSLSEGAGWQTPATAG